jgi:hypothetical protein
MAEKPKTRVGTIAAALGVALAFGSVITGTTLAANEQPVSPAEQIKVAATTGPVNPVGLCRITKACAQ